MKHRDLQQSDDRRVRGAVMAYLEGSKDLKWLAGVIASYRNERDGDLQAAAQIFAGLRGYGDVQRYAELSQWFDSVLGVAQR